MYLYGISYTCVYMSILKHLYIHIYMYMYICASVCKDIFLLGLGIVEVSFEVVSKYSCRTNCSVSTNSDK